MKTAEEFWTWFEKNNYPFLFLNEVDNNEKERLLDLFMEHLHQYCDHLYFEIGGHPSKSQELIISAEGIVKYFPKVEELINKAPSIDNWQFIAFKQPKEDLLKTEYKGLTLDPEKIYFMPLESDSDRNLIGIRIYVPGLAEQTKNDFIAGTYLMLDCLLGEKFVTLDINYLDIQGMQKDPEDLIKITELKSYIKWRKSKINSEK